MASVPEPEVPPPHLSAVFAFPVSQSISSNELENFVVWMRGLPRNIGLSLENVYETQSMCFIFRSGYAFPSNLAGIPGVSLLCETKLPNLVSLVTSTAPPQATGSIGPHLPFSRGSLPPPKR
ncbi:hypothetical protein ASPZODRAFT_667760 [Penicilliopsis zonata CBS 506.65]|uniref:Uncharacterized protein n=1 Tax=Penicilliopsis zonata CBS 506.65 TaxID=1073090 RepID=A0A1L9SCV1_9EURO|nr:hypothetical protein ASPZODRAFT_667760 [Penicilliopsis zonata CBS 506.65]OJJ45011.1 hypothetical protein ASPZODRAFT_667760 [Penicilliopsis zonata CBS 506.65]